VVEYTAIIYAKDRLTELLHKQHPEGEMRFSAKCKVE